MCIRMYFLQYSAFISEQHPEQMVSLSFLTHFYSEAHHKAREELPWPSPELSWLLWVNLPNLQRKQEFLSLKIQRHQKASEQTDFDKFPQAGKWWPYLLSTQLHDYLLIHQTQQKKNTLVFHFHRASFQRLLRCIKPKILLLLTCLLSQNPQL